MKTLNKLLIATLFVFLFSLDFQCVFAQAEPHSGLGELEIAGNTCTSIGVSSVYSIDFGNPAPLIESIQWSVTGGTIISGQGTSQVTVQPQTTICTLSVHIIGTDIEENLFKELYSGGAAASAGEISGNVHVVAGTNGEVYTVPPITNATGYVWSVPSIATIVPGGNTNSITVNFSTTAGSGYITVYGTNGCGDGSTSSKHIAVYNQPAPAGAITGSNTICQGSNNINYSVLPINGATGYVWTLPSGASIASGNNTNSILVNFSSSASSGSVSVYGTNSNGNGSSSSIQVTIGIPIVAGVISGKNFVSPETNGVAYSIASISGATGYSWELPNGATIASGANTNSISVNYLSTATSGTIKVTPIYSCGNGIPSNIAVTVGDITTAGAITINPTVATNNYLLFKTDATNLGVIGSDAKINTSGNASNLGMSVYGNNSLEFSTNSAKRFIINGSGNVGIGTTTPAYKLDVTGDINISTGSSFKVGGVAISSSQWLTGSNNISYNSGNVGIGTTTPATLLAIKRAATTVETTNTYHLGLGISDSPDLTFGTDANYAFIQSWNNKPLQLNNQGNNTIINGANGGLVGIGTITPSSKLDVFGSTDNLFRVLNTSSGQDNDRLNVKIKDNLVTFLTDGSTTAPNILFKLFSYDALFIGSNGVGIGTTTPQNKLDVLGVIRCTEIKVEAPWADFVFHPTYKLRTLGEVEQFIKANNHLPEIPTESEVKQNGIGLGEMNAKLLQKIEELTLYTIEQNNKMDQQQKVNEKQNQLINELERKLEAIANKK